ncbi:MAG TPA: hypothetical protein VFE84_05070, partial [Patescibacteria group bacterium]|nr:hypothetical protein [Patescibacteria group bacterium]
IDGSVLIRTRRELPVGEFLDVEITGAQPYDLIARPTPKRQTRLSSARSVRSTPATPATPAVPPDAARR